jgi:hypothetical protein
MTIEQQLVSPRWRDYVLDYGQGLAEFWKSRLHDDKRHVLFVLGKGFDPYASERNPFEVYRQIRRTILHYREVLGP